MSQNGGDQLLEVADFYTSVQRTVRYVLGKRWQRASPRDLLDATCHATRELMIDRMFETEERYRKARAKRLSYLSVEFLIGQSLGNNLMNLGLLETAREALGRSGADLDELLALEPDAALGNGGLGRLAACYLDSLATLDLPGWGYGINYEHGLFHQRIENSQQEEYPDSWRAHGTPWLIQRRDRASLIPVFGRLNRRRGSRAAGSPPWIGWRTLVGIPHDMPIVGFGGHTVNVLRLYSAHALDEIDMLTFQAGEHHEAFKRKITYERISKLLYPADSTDAGKELRLLQEYFFVACALRDVLGRHLENGERLLDLPEKNAIQLNDTHPALAVVELLRLLMDEYGLEFDPAFDLVRRTMAYTNHTLLPEALEKWPLPLLRRVLPRHLQLIEIVNARFLEEVTGRWPGDLERMARMSIIEEAEPKLARMANLAIIGSHATNGVSELHTELIKTRLVPDFYEMWQERFQSKTNGITPRRWLGVANPGLAELVTKQIGNGWMRDLEQLRALESHVEDAEFRSELQAVKRANKERLAAVVESCTGVLVDPDALFDVQVKRIHEYKRQLLAVLHAIHLYQSIVEDGRDLSAPRVCIFAGKAAPEYFMAKLVIRLICRIGEVINTDERVRGQLKVVFVPDYRVSLAEKIIPAADLSEQISTAGREASGTGNMKLALNGALTIGTLDGANIEIREAVGPENIYIFGLRAEEIEALQGSYDPRHYYETRPNLRRAIDALAEDRLCGDAPGCFDPIRDSLLDHGDPFFVLADFDEYAQTQTQVGRDFQSRDAWVRRAALNIARVGRFSSDRAVLEYAQDIWDLEAVA